MRSRWGYSSGINEPVSLRRTRGAALGVRSGRQVDEPWVRNCVTCNQTVAVLAVVLATAALLAVLCPMLYRARMSKMAARRSLPSYSFESVLRDDECKQLVEQVLMLNPFVDAETGGRGGHDVRQSTVAQLPRSQFAWVYGRVEAGIALANSRAWGYSSLGHVEDLQIVRYQVRTHGRHDHYFWHTDAIKQGTNYFTKYTGNAVASWGDQNQNRLLSMSVQLSNGSEYIGGNLQVGSTNVTRTMGSAVVFPAYMLHRVYPIIKGERLSLVAWLRGKDTTGRFWADAERSYRALSITEPTAQRFLEQIVVKNDDEHGE